LFPHPTGYPLAVWLPACLGMKNDLSTGQVNFLNLWLGVFHNEGSHTVRMYTRDPGKLLLCTVLQRKPENLVRHGPSLRQTHG